jgi:hypothetical protein
MDISGDNDFLSLLQAVQKVMTPPFISAAPIPIRKVRLLWGSGDTDHSPKHRAPGANHMLLFGLNWRFKKL